MNEDRSSKDAPYREEGHHGDHGKSLHGKEAESEATYSNAFESPFLDLSTCLKAR